MSASDGSAADATVVACCQLGLTVGDTAANRDRCATAVEEAARSGARIVVLPELATSGYVFHDGAEARRLAEPVPGRSTDEWQGLARRLGIVIVGGLPEQADDGLLYNAAVIVDEHGILARYRKAHLWNTEKLVFTPGTQLPPVVEAIGHRIAVMICYDVEFPEWVRLAALRGAELLCVPANWPRLPRPQGERPAEVVRVQVAASVNRMFVAACDRVGPERGVEWVGGSVIVDPDGWPLAGPAASSEERVLLAPCRLADATDKSVSERNNVITDRRPSLYGPLVAEEEPA